jgi:hypothetical protein
MLPPERETLATVSLAVPMASVPPETLISELSPRRSDEPRLTVPPLTLRFPAKVPLRSVVPLEAVAAPLPKLALTVPPFRP